MNKKLLIIFLFFLVLPISFSYTFYESFDGNYFFNTSNCTRYSQQAGNTKVGYANMGYFNFTGLPTISLLDNEYYCTEFGYYTAGLTQEFENSTTYQQTNDALYFNGIPNVYNTNSHADLQYVFDTSVSFLNTSRISFYANSEGKGGFYIGFSELDGTMIKSLYVGSTASQGCPDGVQNCCNAGYYDNSLTPWENGTLSFNKSFAQIGALGETCTGFINGLENIKVLTFGATEATTAYGNLYLDNLRITDYYNYEINNLPYWNISWTPTLYVNNTNPTATLNFELDTFDEEYDTIYYSSQTGYNYNKTEVIDFEKYECGLFTCDYVADYGDLEYIYTFENSCSIDTVGVFDYEITIDYHETDEKTFTYLVLNPMCANPIRIYTNVLNSDVNYLEILTSATTIDEFNIFGMTLTGEVLFNFTSIDLNSTVSTIYNNGSQAENVTVYPYMVQFETQNLNDNIYTIKVWDTYNSYSRTYNTSIDTTNKKMAFLGMEVNQGYVGINKIVKSEVIQNFNWTTTKPNSVTFNNAGLYSHKIYITDSYHLPLNEYDTITMDVTVIDTTSYYYNEEGEEFFEEIDNVIGTNWRDYFQNLELNDKLNKFFPWLWFGLLIFFTYTFFVSTHEIKLTLAGLLSSSICLIFAIISRSTIPILSFLVLTGITGIVLIMGTRQ